MTKKPGKKEYREFAWIVGGVLALGFGYIIPILKNGHNRPYLICVGVALMAAGSIYPQCLGPIYHPWMRAGHLLGKVNTFILLHLVFYCIFTPMAIALRLARRRSPAWKMPGENQTKATYRLPSAAQPKERMEDIF